MRAWHVLGRGRASVVTRLFWLFALVATGLALQGCGEKSAYEEKAEADAKERADENKAAHEKRN
jgi:hypothetical protein